MSPREPRRVDTWLQAGGLVLTIVMTVWHFTSGVREDIARLQERVASLQDDVHELRAQRGDHHVAQQTL